MSTLAEAKTQVLQPPARSPDLIPTEHLWDQLKRSVRESDMQINSQQDLTIALKTCRQKTPEDNARHLLKR
ncbi:unnamed protein product [Arctia plantaginis]|uniref:Uncharacterized protein n=1 Tax=Arctia plantaginis TaxID=874455 RepID=A0A8S0YXZ9_ARCPL|nr:unnamed protein product [Arctia plantaginis]